MKYALTADRFRTWLAIGLLALVALASLWVLEVMRRNDAEGNTRTTARSEPDYYVENFNFVRLPNNGQANYHITGARLTHHPRDDNFEIQQPRIKSFSVNQTPLSIRAEHALVEQKSKLISPEREHDQIHLQGDVQVERPESAAAGYLKLQSEYVLLLPDENLMKSDKEVTLTVKNAVVRATGMIADNTRQKVELLGKVHARFSKRDAHPNSNS